MGGSAADPTSPSVHVIDCGAAETSPLDGTMDGEPRGSPTVLGEETVHASPSAWQANLLCDADRDALLSADVAVLLHAYRAGRVWWNAFDSGFWNLDVPEGRSGVETDEKRREEKGVAGRRRRCPPPYVLVFGGTDVNEMGGGGRGKVFEVMSRTVAHADAIVCFSTAVVEAARRLWPLSPDSTATLPPSWWCDRRQLTVRRLPLGEPAIQLDASDRWWLAARTVVIPQAVVLPTSLEVAGESSTTSTDALGDVVGECVDEAACEDAARNLRAELQRRRRRQGRSSAAVDANSTPPPPLVLLLWIGGMRRVKRPGEAIRWARALRDAAGRAEADVWLFMVGGAYEADVTDAVREAIASDQAAWVARGRTGGATVWHAKGVQHERLLRDVVSDPRVALVLNTSASEGQPQSILEAMALGKAVVVSDVPGNTAALSCCGAQACGASACDRLVASDVDDNDDDAELREGGVDVPPLRGLPGTRRRRWCPLGWVWRDQGAPFDECAPTALSVSEPLCRIQGPEILRCLLSSSLDQPLGTGSRATERPPTEWLCRAGVRPPVAIVAMQHRAAAHTQMMHHPDREADRYQRLLAEVVLTSTVERRQPGTEGPLTFPS